MKFDVIIIGGGATGAGLVRDLALRGLKVILLEKNDLAEGTTGRCHGLLHSGGRYVASDPIAARECAKENKILRKIAPHIIDSCNGYFIGFPEDDQDYIDKFPEHCRDANVQVDEISVEKFLKQEPNVSSEIIKVFKVYDAYIDPFLLTYYNALDAVRHGAIIKNYAEVQQLIMENQQVKGVSYLDKTTKSKKKIYANIVINATGPWAGRLEKQLQLEDQLNIEPTIGTLIIYDKRLTNCVINRLKYPGDGDIIVPSHQSVIVGTTSRKIDEKQLDRIPTTKKEIEKMKTCGIKLIPKLENQRMLRYYSGARPLVKLNSESNHDFDNNTIKNYTSDVSRKFEIIDYETKGYKGFITVFGGKLTTYRLMAQEVGNLVSEKLGVKKQCITAERILPGGDNPWNQKEIEDTFNLESRVAFDMSVKWGSFLEEMSKICTECLNASRNLTDPEIICKCEQVSESELRWVKENMFITNLDDYRRRTRQGMGRCQGQFCMFKLADLESQWSTKSHRKIISEMIIALKKRWKTEIHADPMLKRQIKLSKYMYLLGGGLK